MSATPSPRWLERVIFGVSVVVVLGVAGALVWFDRPFEPAAVSLAPHIRTADVERTTGRLVVPFEVTNRGRLSVDGVSVEVRLGAQTREQHIDHLPQGATHRGVVVFYDPPTGAVPEARVLGYALP